MFTESRTWPNKEVADLEERILDVLREKNLPFRALTAAEKAAGVPSGTKPTVEQLQAVLTALESM